MRKVRTLTVVRTMGTLLIIGAMAQRASASFHLWKINEIYSNADGSIQFIEMRDSFNFENFLAGHHFTTNGNDFIYPNNLSSTSTANKNFLMATSGFAALPGTPAPDYIIPNSFFNPSGDTLTFVAGLFPPSIVTFTSGQLPLCGTLSLNANLTTSPNSPTTFAGVTGPITMVFAPLGDLNGDCKIDLLDLALMASNWMIDCLSHPNLPGCAP